MPTGRSRSWTVHAISSSAKIRASGGACRVGVPPDDPPAIPDIPPVPDVEVPEPATAGPVRAAKI